MGLCILSLWACKEDPVVNPAVNFESITRADIVAKAAEINLESIPYDNSNSTGFKVGSIIFFKTSVMGNYGKLKVLSLNEPNQLVLHVVVYAENGTIIADNASFSPEYSGAKAYDLDQLGFPEGDLVLSDLNFSIANGFPSLNWVNNSRAFVHAN